MPRIGPFLVCVVVSLSCQPQPGSTKPPADPAVTAYKQEARKLIPDLHSLLKLVKSNADAETVRRVKSRLEEAHSRLPEPPPSQAATHAELSDLIKQIGNQREMVAILNRIAATAQRDVAQLRADEAKHEKGMLEDLEKLTVQLRDVEERLAK